MRGWGVRVFGLDVTDTGRLGPMEPNMTALTQLIFSATLFLFVATLFVISVRKR